MIKSHDKWFWSDQHLYHGNILKFPHPVLPGQRLRPFETIKEMHECMLDNHNELVKPGDFVYWLGDVALNTAYDRQFSILMHRFNGDKRLIPGNHDKYVDGLFRHFNKVEYWKGFHFKDQEHLNFTCTHVPHCLDNLRDGKYNVHGHTHANEMADPHYINVCVEVRNYKPVHLDTILKEIADIEKDLVNRAKIDKNLNKGR